MEIIPPPQPSNPTPEERLKLLYFGLELNERPEDFTNIINLFNPPQEISTILPPGSCKGIKVAVLGGGLAGLSAAFELRKLGFDITIYEAEENRVGGRVLTHYFDKRLGLYGELGPLRFPVAHQSLWHYIDLFRLNTRPFIVANENTFRYVGGVRSRNTPDEVQRLIYPLFNLTPEEKNTPWPSLEARILEDYIRPLAPEVRAEILELREIYSPAIASADYYNINQALQNANLSRGAISMLSSVNPFLGGYLDEGHINFLQDAYPLNFLYMYELIGGLATLPKAFYRSLINPCPTEYGECVPLKALGKVTFKRGHQVTGLSQREGGSVAVQYKERHSSIKRTKIFDFIVCGIPFSNLRLIDLQPQFNIEKMEAIRQLNLSPAQKTIFLCNRRFWEKDKIIGGTSSTDLVINSILYPTDTAPIDSPGVITASYNWTQDALRLGNFIRKDAIEIIKRQIEEIHGLPKFILDSIVVAHKTILWTDHPWALGAFTFTTSKQNQLYARVSIAPEYNNRVFFAGEHVSNAKGWMQGALQTGMFAANNIALKCQQYT